MRSTYIMLAGLLLSSLSYAEAPSDLREVLELAADELVRGNLECIRDGDVVFDSDDLGQLVIGWGDVVAFDFPEAHTYRFDGRRVFIGPARMRNDIITIQTELGAISLPRQELVSVTQGTGREWDFWSGGATVGYAAQSGNTEQADLTARAGVMRETALTRFRTSYIGNVTTFDNDTTANNHRVSETFDIFITDRFFITTPFFDFTTDEFQNIDIRLVPGAGVGYEIVDNSWLYWDATAGAAYQYTKFESVERGSDRTSHDAAGVFSTSFNLDLPRGVEWDNLYRITVVFTDTAQTSQHALSVLSFDVWGPLDLEVSFQWDRIHDPEPLADGSVPKSDDYRYAVGLGLDF